MSWIFSDAMMKAYANSRFSQALVAEYSAASSLDGEPSAQLSVMPTQHKFWLADKTMEHSTLSRFGLTCVVLTEDLGAELLTWFQAGFHAQTSQLPEEALALKVKNPGYGEKWRASLARFDLNTCSLRTAQLSLLEDSTECSLTLPRWGSMLDGECFQHPDLEHHISERESGLWPTPDASCGRRGWCRQIAEKVRDGIRKRKSGATIGSSLAWEPRLLEDYSLGMRLNPDWLEWLMGWPIAHTGLLPLETGKFLEWQQQHSPCCQEVGDVGNDVSFS